MCIPLAQSNACFDANLCVTAYGGFSVATLRCNRYRRGALGDDFPNKRIEMI